MLQNFYLKRHFWIYSTLAFSFIFFILDELFVYGLSFVEPEYRLFLHRTALFLIVVLFIGWTQYSLRKIVEMNKQIVDSAKLATLGELSATVTHEIVRPLSTLKLKSDLFIKKDINEDLTTFSTFVLKQLDRIESLIHSLRMFGRKSTDLKKSNHKVEEIIDDTINLVNPYIGFTALNREVEEDLPDLFCNNIQIEQVLSNLLINAKDALGNNKDGIISIKAFKGDKALIIEVSDNGEGIPKKIQDRIFEPFYTTKEEGKGTGLGLAIIKKIISNHNGKVELQSVPGNTSFILTFNQ